MLHWERNENGKRRSRLERHRIIILLDKFRNYNYSFIQSNRPVNITDITDIIDVMFHKGITLK